MKIIKRILPSNTATTRVATKYLQETRDGFVVEATYIKRPEKHTLCVSTQIGCVIGCRFCASGLRGRGMVYQRSLSSAEIIEECRNVVREINFTAHLVPLTFAFMGEGEPFLNFDECVKALRALAVAEWPVPVRFSISTSGIRPDLIRRLSNIGFPARLKLHVSLHGPNDDIRSRLVPISKSVSDIVAAVQVYRERCGRPVAWNYVMCSGVNDSLEDAGKLAKLLGPAWHIKFTRLNLTDNSLFLPSSRERVEQFRLILEKNGLSTTYSETDESNIQAGCGQLSYHYAQEKHLHDD